MTKLGHTYKDKITGLEGVATGYVKYISGCNQVLIAPRCGSDGAVREPHWFDQQRLDEVPGVPVVELDNGSTPGCDRSAPVR